MESVRLSMSSGCTNPTSKTVTKQRSQRMRHFLDDKVVRWPNTLMQVKTPLLDQLTFPPLQANTDRCVNDLNFI